MTGLNSRLLKFTRNNYNFNNKRIKWRVRRSLLLYTFFFISIKFFNFILCVLFTAFELADGPLRRVLALFDGPGILLEHSKVLSFGRNWALPRVVLFYRNYTTVITILVISRYLKDKIRFVENFRPVKIFLKFYKKSSFSVIESCIKPYLYCL